MAAESVGMSQKKKDRAATIGMIIFFSILAISVQFRWILGMCRCTGTMKWKLSI